MKNIFSMGLLFLTVLSAWGQEGRHTDKFEQLNHRPSSDYRTGSGSPGHRYWQQKADYDIAVELDEEKLEIRGQETITYTNNSPDALSYLWLQLDQNIRDKNSDKRLTKTNAIQEQMSPWKMDDVIPDKFDGGFNIISIKDVNGKDLSYIINKTMMAVDLPTPLKSGETIKFSIKWNYPINDVMKGARSGYESFPDGNYTFAIAQFYPRMCVYNDYDGWQNKQFLGNGEFALTFGSYNLKITVPADHIVGATGLLMNPKEVLTKTQIERLQEAENATDPVMIVTEAEADKNKSSKSKEKKTWIFKSDNVRDVAFSSSRKFIWDAMGVEIEGAEEFSKMYVDLDADTKKKKKGKGSNKVMAMSYYPKEGNPLWEKYSTRTVAHTLKTYSKYTFPYPYHKAISVHVTPWNLGMEYPMICFNWGRPRPDGSYSPEMKYYMVMVIIHEVGHNYFPMIVNSDERQWAWMDEGLNTFLQYLTEQEWYEGPLDSREGPPQKIVPYMSMDKTLLSPIMTNPEQVQQLGPNAYGKPATALNILRQTIMGPELFDRAFKEYSRRWAFKHPTPADFFRTMEDASGTDLDWFWRGWFYSVDNVDIALTGIKRYQMTDKEPEKSEKEKIKADTTTNQEVSPDDIKTFYAQLAPSQVGQIKKEANFYELTFENKGGLVMPVILEISYEDDSKEIIQIPAEIWRKNAEKATKVFVREKKITKIVLDPFLETADTDLENNYWPKKLVPNKFKEFLLKTEQKGE